MNNITDNNDNNNNNDNITDDNITDEAEAKPTYRSPAEMMKAANEFMLDGRGPVTTTDWYKVMNFCAANVHPAVAESACLLIKMLYNMPIPDEDVKNIVAFQLDRR